MSFTLDNPYKRFVRMLARALYDGPPPLDNRKLKPGQSDNAGLAVLVVDALTREGWISDEDLNNQIKVPYKQLQRVLQCLENEKLITRKHCRKDTTGEREEGEGHKVKENERKKPQLIAYSSLEYAQAYDVLRYRILIIKTKLKPHSTYDSGRIPQFICSGCHFSYDPFNVIKLDQDGDNFICERCQKIVVEEEIEQDDGSTEKLKKFEEQLEPLTKQAYLSTVKAPQFVPFHVWEAAKAAGTDKQAPEEETKPSKNEKKKLETKGVDAALREVLAPWMVKKEGDIVIEKEQTIQQSEPEVEEKKEESEEDIKKRQVQEEYLKAYYETLYNQQATVADVEDVGQKRKRRDSEEVEDEDSELKEAVKNDNQEGEEVASTTVDDNDDENIWQDG